jgi:hypothetical protein
VLAKPPETVKTREFFGGNFEKVSRRPKRLTRFNSPEMHLSDAATLLLSTTERMNRASH